MGMARDLTGVRSERLVGVRMVGRNRHGQRLWSCLCDCGRQPVVIASRLATGAAKSCGCLIVDRAREQTHNLRHGHTSRKALGRPRSATYVTWSAMIRRCSDPGDQAFSRYGGAGVRVCDAWIRFDGFLADMGARPRGTSIDRIDNTKGYEPGNCRWATSTVQNRNSGSCKITEATAQEVLGRLEHGESPSSIAVRMSLARTMVYSIKRGDSWGDLLAPSLKGPRRRSMRPRQQKRPTL